MKEEPKIPIQAIFEAYEIDVQEFAHYSHVYRDYVTCAYKDIPISWTAAEQILKDLSQATGGIFNLNNTDIKTITHSS